MNYKKQIISKLLGTVKKTNEPDQYRLIDSKYEKITRKSGPRKSAGQGGSKGGMPRLS